MDRDNYYDRLGVAPTATAADIRSAYRDLARALHPDRANGNPSPRMVAINEAWSVLGDSARRADYDAELARLRARRGETVAPRPPTVEEPEPLDDEEPEDEWRLDVPITDGRAVQTLAIMLAVTGALAAIAVAALFAYAILR